MQDASRDFYRQVKAHSEYGRRGLQLVDAARQGALMAVPDGS